jgi:hypothetical protein
MLVVAVVGRLPSDLFFVDLVGLIGDELRVGIVGLVRLGVLTYRDALVFLGQRRRGSFWRLGTDHNGCGRVLFGGLGIGWDRSGLFLVGFLVGPCGVGLRFGGVGLRFGGVGFDLGDRVGRDLDRELEDTLFVAHEAAGFCEEVRDGQLVVVDLRDDAAALSEQVVGTNRGADPENQRGFRFTLHHGPRARIG